MTKQPCPSCVETIADWLANDQGFTVSAGKIYAHFLPKSPAQALAEECPYGMTVEQAQWVLDRFDHQKDTPMEIQNLVSRFLQWPLPKAVCSDACVSMPDYKFPRSGTNLLTATEAEQMLRFVLSDLLDPEWGGDLTAEETSMIDAADLIAELLGEIERLQQQAVMVAIGK